LHIVPTGMTVADFCAELEAGSITVNLDYQRSDKVWPPAARSFLIETLLLGLPVPKLFLHQITDVRTRRTLKEIVDGQQRARAIKDFYDSRLRLSRTHELEDAAGLTYEQLDEHLKAAFLDYRLDMDLFVGAASDDVREVFRRMNSYTVPLNPEEQRHASRQGPFKWFIHRLSSDYDEALLTMSVFSQRQLVRMQDAKLLTEVSHALLYGISTTSKRKLDDLYRSRDVEFSEEEWLDRVMRRALDALLEMTQLQGTALTKPHIVYSLLLALIHSVEAVPVLTPFVGSPPSPPTEDTDPLEISLGTLAGALEAQDEEGPYTPFVRASGSRTNVESQRAERFRWLLWTLPERD